MRRSLAMVIATTPVLFGVSVATAEEKTAAQRGREVMLGRLLTPPDGSARAYESLWKRWPVKDKPADYTRAVMERYGLHEPPYENQGLPMGLRYGSGILGKGVGHDCLLCHAGSVAGQSVIGLGNASLDLRGLIEDLLASDGIKLDFSVPLSAQRGTIEASAAVVFLMQFRDAELNLQKPAAHTLPSDLCEDVPAWWQLKKKKTMYHTGTTDARSVRTLMPFLLSPLHSGPAIRQQETAFADIQAYLLSLEPPKYPFPIEQAKAAHGKEIFTVNCAKCHGTYGPDGKYPNKVVPHDVIGTDRSLAQGVTPEAAEHYLRSWFAQDKGPDTEPYIRRYPTGYQAPPLDGVWATAPYFHNASVPTVYHVLNSNARPKVFTRSYRTGKADYDEEKLGWRFTVLEKGPDPSAPGLEQRKVYDTTRRGRGNGGHTFGDDLTEAERLAVIEYLKTL